MAAFLRDCVAKSPTNSLVTGNDLITLTSQEPTDENLTSGQASALANRLAQNQKSTQEVVVTNRELKKSLRTVTDAIHGINFQETTAARKAAIRK